VTIAGGDGFDSHGRHRISSPSATAMSRTTVAYARRIPVVCHEDVLVAILGTLAIVGVFVAVGLWVDRRVSLLPRPEELAELSRPKPLGADHEVGLAPQSALHLDTERMTRVIERQRCACKTQMAQDGEDEVRYDAKRLRVVRMKCPACGAVRSLYFDPK
jgi:hypothetical protein